MDTVSYHLSLCGVLHSPQGWARLVQAMHRIPNINLFQHIFDTDGDERPYTVAPNVPPQPGQVHLACTIYAQRMDMDTPYKPLETAIRELGLGYVWTWKDDESPLSWAQVKPWWRPHGHLLTLDGHGPLVRLSESRDPAALAAIEDAYADYQRVGTGALHYASSAHDALALQKALNPLLADASMPAEA